VPTPSGLSISLDVVSAREVGMPPEAGAAARRGGVRLSVAGSMLDGRALEWRAGRTLRMPALLRPPSTYLNPGTPDERPALARRGVMFVGTVKSATLIQVVARGGAVAEGAAAIRAWIRRQVARALSPVDAAAAGVTTAVLIGDRTGLSEEDQRRLQDAGTYHVIAISGGNIAILAVVFGAVWRLLCVGGRSGSILTALLLTFYGVVAGGSASVARAVTVAVLVLAARAIDHRAHPLNAVGVAALLAVALAPSVVLDAGFLLSFGATVGILLGIPFFVTTVGSAARHHPASTRLRRAVLLMLAATLCAEAALMPVSAAFFARVSFAGLVLNFAAIPLMAMVQIGGLLIVATAGWIPVATWLAAAVHAASAALLGSAALVEVAPWLAIDVPPPVWWLIGLYYAAALIAICRRSRRPAVALIAAGAVMLFGARPTSRDAVAPSRLPLRVAVLDVGQGDATVVSLPGGRTLLVDTGGLAPLSAGPDPAEAAPGFDVGERVVAPALRALGVGALDHLVLTHGDPDHIGGVRGLLRHLRARSIWEGVPVPPHGGLRLLATAARQASISWRTVQAGDAERFGEVEVRVLHPPPPEWERQRIRNEDSIVLEIRIGAVSIVLPGDIGREGERAILPGLEPGRTVILKAPHHGSATSSTAELLAALRPAAVIFSCGRNNRFGHPHPEVVERYRTLGAAIFSTAEDGAVFVDTDGRRVEVRGFGGRRATFAHHTSHETLR
jgi:competence protein ComEC